MKYRLPLFYCNIYCSCGCNTVYCKDLYVMVLQHFKTLLCFRRGESLMLTALCCSLIRLLHKFHQGQIALSLSAVCLNAFDRVSKYKQVKFFDFSASGDKVMDWRQYLKQKFLPSKKPTVSRTELLMFKTVKKWKQLPDYNWCSPCDKKDHKIS